MGGLRKRRVVCDCNKLCHEKQKKTSVEKDVIESGMVAGEGELAQWRGRVVCGFVMKGKKGSVEKDVVESGMVAAEGELAQWRGRVVCGFVMKGKKGSVEKDVVESGMVAGVQLRAFLASLGTGPRRG